MKALDKIQIAIEKLEILNSAGEIPESDYMIISNLLEDVLNDNGVNTSEIDF